MFTNGITWKLAPVNRRLPPVAASYQFTVDVPALLTANMVLSPAHNCTLFCASTGVTGEGVTLAVAATRFFQTGSADPPILHIASSLFQAGN